MSPHTPLHSWHAQEHLVRTEEKKKSIKFEHTGAKFKHVWHNQDQTCGQEVTETCKYIYCIYCFIMQLLDTNEPISINLINSLDN